MARISFFIDGFNLYHSLESQERFPHLKQYKWLDIKRLCSLFIKPTDELKDIFYCTAYANWLPDKAVRHRHYVRALEFTGVKPIFGQFKIKDKKCRLCHRKYKGHEEKETDVNIAIGIFREAVADTYDTAFILSADSDLLPAIKGLRLTFPNKTVKVLLPIGSYAEELKNTTECVRLKEKHLKASQFPDRLDCGKGVILEKPAKWSWPSPQPTTP